MQVGKALGGQVTRAAVKEIGWGEVRLEDAVEAPGWFGSQRAAFLSFHWHGETFTIPPGATRILSSPWCANQAFSLGKHLGLQCHIEMTEDLVRAWCRSGEREIRASDSPTIMSMEAILADLEPRLEALHQVADSVYARWVRGLARA